MEALKPQSEIDPAIKSFNGGAATAPIAEPQSAIFPTLKTVGDELRRFNFRQAGTANGFETLTFFPLLSYNVGQTRIDGDRTDVKSVLNRDMEHAEQVPKTAGKIKDAKAGFVTIENCRTAIRFL